jgi:hypothetical protein
MLSYTALCETLDNAVSTGDLERAQSVHELMASHPRIAHTPAYCRLSRQSVKQAAKMGRLRVLEWAREQGMLESDPREDYGVMVDVAESAQTFGQWHVLQWAAGYGWWTSNAVAKVMARNDLYGVQWLYGQGHAFPYTLCADAAYQGFLSILVWLVEVARRPWRPALCLAKIDRLSSNHKRLSCWITEAQRAHTRADRARWSIARATAFGDIDGDTDQLRWHARCSEAASRGAIDLLSLLDKCTRFERDSRACTAAAGAGQMDAIVWLRDHGFAWGDVVCAAAAREGHLDTLVRLVDGGCPWDRRQCMSLAAEHDRADVIAWITSRPI